MKIVKTASSIEVKMSQKEWQEIGKKAQWSSTIPEEDRYSDLLSQNGERLDDACQRAADTLKQQGVTPEYFIQWAQRQSADQESNNVDQQFAQQQDLQANQVSLESDNLDRQPNVVAQKKEAGWLNTQTICPKCKAMLSNDNGFKKGLLVKCPNCRNQFDASRYPPRQKKVEAPVESPEENSFFSKSPF